MTIWIALMISCSNTNLDRTIRCDYGQSDEVYASKAQCLVDAYHTYRRPVKCIDVVVEMKGTDKKVILK